ncbi:Structural maintenance of chromosomes protein 6 [Allomyces arbusculus]|nr:Structural maintenance of chromosomes protein 6 [Allomyces arbusculus]
MPASQTEPRPTRKRRLQEDPFEAAAAEVAARAAPPPPARPPAHPPARAPRRRAGTASGGTRAARLLANHDAVANGDDEDHLARRHLAGVIEEIELTNFLTHASLVVKLGPKVNFLNGANGSGKSAVLASIMIALGAKANNSGRGKKLAQLIKDGKNECKVSVKLANRGADAYRPEIFGDFIQVERRITRNERGSGGGYAIRGEHGKVSDRKKDLDLICDHFGIHVDNSLTWLTQDAAKEFLMNVKDTDLYAFFAKGADIDQTQEVFRTMGQQLAESAERLNRIEESMSALKNNRNLKRQQMQYIQQAEGLQHQIDALTTELEWCDIADMEAALNKLHADIQAHRARIAESDAQRATAEAKVADFDQRLVELETAQAETFDPEQMRTKQGEFHTLQKKVRDLTNEIKTIQRDVTDLDREIQALQGEIAQANRAISGDAQQARAARLAELAEAKDQLQQGEAEIPQLQAQLVEVRDKRRALEADARDLHGRIGQIESYVRQKEGNIRQLEYSRKDKLNIWGQSTALVLRDIQQTQWHDRAPLGPLGLHVKPKPEYARTWMHTLRCILGRDMSNFAVASHEDRKRLQAIFDRHRHRAQIMVVQNWDQDMDLSSTSPDPRYLTVFKALNLDAIAVKKALVVTKNIEKLVLFDDRETAERETARGFPYNVENTYIPSGFAVGSRTSDKSIDGRVQWNQPFCPFGTDTGTDQLPKLQADIERGQADLKLATERYHRIAQELKTVTPQAQPLETRIRHLQTAHRRLQSRIRTLEDDIQESAPAEVAALERELATLQERKHTLTAQQPTLRQQLQDAQRDAMAVNNDLKAMRAMQTEAETVRTERNAQREHLQRQRVRALAHVEHWIRKADEDRTLVAQREAQAAEQQRHIDMALQQMPGERPPVLRTRADVDQAMAYAEARRNAIRAQYGNMTVDQARAEYEHAQNTYQAAKREHVTLSTVIGQLRQALANRGASFNTLVNYISLAADASFQKRMAKRGFRGNLIFDHAKKTLHVSAQLLDQTVERSLRTYSGGEKSFSTVCLLLALWDAMPSPIRCLDEFDVYMDEVNRSEAMKMLMEAALQSESQFVFITPLTLRNLEEQKGVKIMRLPDPVRNNVQ